jgi:hypothetical protein
LTRAAFVDGRGFLTREGVLFLDAIRSALGGDAAIVNPADPTGALSPVGAFFGASDALLPLSVIVAIADLSPVSLPGASGGLEPTCVPASEMLP